MLDSGYNSDADLEDFFEYREDEGAPYVPFLGQQSWPTESISAMRLELDENWIDCNRLRQWLDLCDKIHGNHCRTVLKRPNGASISPRWLIDVNQLCVAPGSSQCDYYALSYVWGRIETLHATQENLSDLQKQNSLRDLEDKLPQTIADAIALVRKLGRQYLWVDQLCIPQDDEMIRRLELSSMAAIYQNAYATIIAAEGDDADYGLSGIHASPRSLSYFQPQNMMAMYAPARTRARLLQPDYHGELSDTEMMKCFTRMLVRTTWCSRGWTFQELVFATRRIYFHNNTVNWECLRGTIHEAQNTALSTIREPCQKTPTSPALHSLTQQHGRISTGTQDWLDCTPSVTCHGMKMLWTPLRGFSQA